jgi:hypothetical protein
MAKDRAKDPKRVPSLGISAPISHVSVIENPLEDPHTTSEERADEMHEKRDALGMYWHTRGNDNANKNFHAKAVTDMDRKKGTLPVVKINSDPTAK